jgi:hypothetical protein
MDFPRPCAQIRLSVSGMADQHFRLKKIAL